MGFGLCNAPAMFSRVINLVMKGLNWKTALAFLDYILIMGQIFDDHMGNFRQALEKFRQYQMKMNPKKWLFMQKNLAFLGRIISKHSKALSAEHSRVVLEWPAPKISKEVEQFLGWANYHRNFVKNFAQIAVQLTTLKT